MLYVFTENRKNDRSRNTNTGNWREQNLATFWVLNRKKMKYVGILISTLFKNISCEKFVIEKEKKKRALKKSSFSCAAFVSCKFRAVSCYLKFRNKFVRW